MIDLRISMRKSVRLCELTLSFITALAPIDLLGYLKSFKVRFWTLIPAFPWVSVVLL